jgi:DNA-binding MarR family transcriptional regulator
MQTRIAPRFGCAKARFACTDNPNFRYDRGMLQNPPPSPDQQADSEQPMRVLRQFRIVFNAVKSHFRQVEREAGVGGAQLWALSVIDRHPGIGATGLARELDIHQSTASNLVRGLVERGYVTGSREGADRRTVALHVQPAGQEVLRRAPMPFAGVLPDALASLDPAVLMQLEKNLGQLIAQLDVDEEAGSTPLAQL